MATVLTLPVASHASRLRRMAESETITIALCTLVAFVLLGYHPYAEDGGIYAAALALKLDGSLFPAYRAFATAHTGRSLFLPLLAACARALHLSVPSALLLAHLLTLALTLASASALLREWVADHADRRWILLTFAVSLGLPVAGTSLYLADPYLTARSLSTPLLLVSLRFALQRRATAALLMLATAFAVHPLMAVWASLLVAALLATYSRQARGLLTSLAVAAVVAMGLLQGLTPLDSPAAQLAARSRSYWFLGGWTWYEQLGTVLPVLLLASVVLLPVCLGWVTDAERRLATAASVTTLACALGAALFVHSGNQSLLLARMQPLRLLHAVYLIFVLLLGTALTRLRIAGRRVAPLVCFLAAVSLGAMQRCLYKSSAHLEVPWREPRNGYAQAFLWARENTPKDAVFAMDAAYTDAPGENTQSFRAIAQRSALPDLAKDGGIASVMPRLASPWLEASDAQRGFNVANDEQRRARVMPLGASWMILPADAVTVAVCPYRNRTAKVCLLHP